MSITPVAWPECHWKIGCAQMPQGGIRGFDPWLACRRTDRAMETAWERAAMTLRAYGNLVDRIWADQPHCDAARQLHPIELPRGNG